MSKKVSLVNFTGRWAAKLQYSDGTWDGKDHYVDSMQSWVERALERGIKVEATAREAKTMLLDIVGNIPLPEEEEPKMKKVYGLKTRGGRKAFVLRKKAEDHWKRYYSWRPGAVLDILEVEVKA